jgi:hypothetical protein
METVVVYSWKGRRRVMVRGVVEKCFYLRKIFVAIEEKFSIAFGLTYQRESYACLHIMYGILFVCGE